MEESTTQTNALERGGASSLEMAQAAKIRLLKMYDATGLNLVERTSIDELRLHAKFMRYLGEGMMWRLGDMLIFSERKFGEHVEELMRLTGYSYDSCKNAKYTASRIPKGMRRPNVSFSHHMAVAPLNPEEQERFLNETEEKGLSIIQLRTLIAQARAAVDTTAQAVPAQSGTNPTNSASSGPNHDPTAGFGAEAASDALRQGRHPGAERTAVQIGSGEPVEIPTRPVVIPADRVAQAARRDKAKIRAAMKELLVPLDALSSAIAAETSEPGEHADEVMAPLQKVLASGAKLFELLKG